MNHYSLKAKFISIILVLVLLNFGRLFFIHDLYWDDNCWILSRYSTNGLEEFLNHGFNQMRRSGLGIFFYYIFGIFIYTDYGFYISNTLSNVIQLITAIMVYQISLLLTNRNYFFAFILVLMFLSNTIDHTMPYLSSLNYRLGFLLEIISIYLTTQAILESTFKRWKILFALFLTTISAYMLTESVVAMEPIRILIGSYIYYKKNHDIRSAFISSLKRLKVFIVLIFPLMIYKIAFKPFGMYESIYKTDFATAFTIEPYWDVLRRIFFGFWWHIPKDDNQGVDILLGAIAALIVFILCYFLHRSKKIIIQKPENTTFLILIGFLIIIFQNFLFIMAGRGFKWGPDSTHGNFMQLGTSIILASLVFLLFHSLSKKISKDFLSKLLPYIFYATISVVVGYGTYINNTNLTLFQIGSIQQESFWKKFINRFPVLPNKANFLFDIDLDKDIPSFHQKEDLDTGYDLEAYLNSLYATNLNPYEFHKYSVLAPEEIHNLNIKFNSRDSITRDTRYGLETIDINSLIIVRYRNGEILVDDEIILADPNVPYKNWITKKNLRLPNVTPIYILRGKSFILNF